MSAPHTPVRDRVRVLDGLRGIAIVLVVLSHNQYLEWPRTRGEGSPVVRALFENGNYAVSIFFVVGAFLYTRNLLNRAESPHGLHPGVQLMRRYLRLTPGVVALLLVAVVLLLVERENSYAGQSLGESSRALLTYQWNWYVKSHPFEARQDFGHLWYLSVDMQAFLVILLLVWALHRRPEWLIGVLLGVLAVVLAWKGHVYQTEGIYNALLRTNARIDAPLSGALAACLMPYLRPVARWAPTAAWVSFAAVVLLAFPMVDEVNYFTAPGALLDLSLALFVLGCALAPVPVLLTRTLGCAPLAFLGKRSLSLYIWHFPIFDYVWRHSDSWSWQQRTAVSMALALVAATIADRTVERWAGKALTDPRWSSLDRGIPHFVARRITAASQRHVEAAAPSVPDASASVEDASAPSVEDGALSGDAGGRPSPGSSGPSRPRPPDGA